MYPVAIRQSLTIHNFFMNFISNPLSSELSKTDKAIAFLCSLILAPLTFGILHIATYIWRKRRVEYYAKSSLCSPTKLTDLIQKIASCPAIAKLQSSSPSTFTPQLTRSTLGAALQTHLIDPYYAKPHPSRGEVTVPVETISPTGEKTIQWRKWRSLSQNEKVRVNNTGTRPHNQLKGPFAPFIVDLYFNPPFSDSHISRDPHRNHGSDHAVRVSLFSAIFACLYQKYHPNYQVTEKDILLSQFIGAGHDTGRLTEGPDVYDEKSAAYTQKALQAVGFHSPEDMADCHYAIARKDDPDVDSKPLIAKCVQNADSADFARLSLTDSLQEGAEFERGRTYLDIYTEFLSFREKGIALKDGLSFEEFQEELDGLRIEMNRFIVLTSQPDFRKKASESSSYYDTVLQCITPFSFPLLYAALRKTEVLPPPSPPETISFLKQIDGWIAHGLPTVSTPFLHSLSCRLHRLSSDNPREKEKLHNVQLLLQKEVERRESAFMRYGEIQEKSQGNRGKILEAYAQLPTVLQDENDLFDTLQLPSYQDIERHIRQEDDIPSFALQFLELKQGLLSLKEMQHNPTTPPAALFEEAKRVHALYRHYPKTYQDARDQTTLAASFQQAARTLLSQGNMPLYHEVVHYAEEALTPNSELEKLLTDTSPHVRFATMGTEGVRKQAVRIEPKTIDGKEFFEISFELTSRERQSLHFDTTGSLYTMRHVPSRFEKREAPGVFSSRSATTIPLMCQDLLLTPKGSKALSLRIGDTSLFWNQYHLVRIRFDRSTSLQEVQKLLCRAGLMTALMPSRSEDIRLSCLSRLLASRFPQIVYSSTSLKDARIVYSTLLNDYERKQIDEDMKKMRWGFTSGAIEAVLPPLGEEIKEAGGVALGIGINAGSTKATAETLVHIVKTGLLSSQERFQRGILGLGTVPVINNFAGSANQVFTRILTHKLFQEEYSLRHFQLAGPIFLLTDLQACERMPYAYRRDLSGVRNPHYFTPLQMPPGDFHQPTFFFHGRREIRLREDLPHLAHGLNNHAHLTNECMFDNTLGPEYIRKILVQSEEDRATVLDTLYKNGIHYIHGMPIEDAVILRHALTPELERELLSSVQERDTLYDQLRI